MLAGCFSSLILYAVRLYFGLTTMKRFRDDRYAFHNFQNAAGIDEVSLTTVNSAIVTSPYANLIHFCLRVNDLED